MNHSVLQRLPLRQRESGQYVFGTSITETRMNEASHNLQPREEERRLDDAESRASELRRQAENERSTLKVEWQTFVNEVRESVELPNSVLGCVIKFGPMPPAFISSYLQIPVSRVDAALDGLVNFGILERDATGAADLKSI